MVFGTVGRRGLHMSARVSDPVDDSLREFNAITEIATGLVIDRIHIERSRTHLRTQGVDERLSRHADARRLARAPGEHDLDIRTPLGEGGWDGCTQQRRPGHYEGGAKDTNHAA